MSKALPKKFFPVCGQAKITFRKVDRWAEIHAKNGVAPYFETWLEAHGYMLNKARSSLARLERDLAAAKRHLAKVAKMEEPPCA